MQLREVSEPEDLIALVDESPTAGRRFVFLQAGDYVSAGNLLVGSRRAIEGSEDGHAFRYGETTFRSVPRWRAGWAAINEVSF